MKRTRSITARLALVFLFLLLVVSLLGAFCIGSLGYFNEVAARVRDRWLPSTGVLADLNNVTSDFRAAEGASLLAADAREIATSDALLAELDRKIDTAERNYRQIPQEVTEEALFTRFVTNWDDYHQIVQRVRRLAQGGDRAAAVAMYGDASKAAYDAASDTLDLLTARSIASAREASAREELAYERARWLIFATIVLTCLAVAAAMAHVRRSISAPILSLADRMHRLAANQTNIEIDGTERADEIGEMARAVLVFRGNAIELMGSQIGLEQQATMLRERLAEEQRLMSLQRNFISMASHEFRTPITLIDGHAQFLQSMKDGGALAERARKIRNAARRMTHLIENLIESMRVLDKDVKLYFHPTSINIELLIHEACLLQREIAPRAQILETLATESLEITGDAQLLFQVIGNILSNAIKYSPDGGLIHLTLSSIGSAAVIKVRDHGIGIPAADRVRLFERYFRGGNTAGIVGTGIGLYFVKTVVELHGGEIEVESREGEGSCITLRLPLRAQAALQQSAAPVALA